MRIDIDKLLLLPLPFLIFFVFIVFTKQTPEASEENIIQESPYHIMSDEEKQNLLAKKYSESHLIEDEYELSIIKGEVPTLISTPSEKWIFGYFDELGAGDSIIGKIILVYDVEKDSLNFLVPPGSSDYGETDMLRSQYKDYKLFNNHLYLIHSDLGHLYLSYAPHSIYIIDIDDSTWYMVGEGESYGEETCFIDDMIKAQIYYLVKEDEWWGRNEYSDSIQWIRME